MPKKIKKEGDFDKASIKTSTKEVLREITKDKGLYEYELIDNLLRKEYPEYFKNKENE